jgi:hypothetical protein
MRRSTVLLALLLVALLVALAAKGLLVQSPPLRTQSASGAFDTALAKGRLAYILGDERPHPADTPQSDIVRARLIVQLEQIGLKPIVRDQFACNELYKQRGVSCARVRNVLVTLGPAHGRALLLNAHYDSTPVGPGAADDGIGVATLLEVGSILHDRRLARPVILLFNEGEELGLVGARAFLADPLSRNIDALVNLEARGVRGPVAMFETSRPNAAPIALLAAAVERPSANSLSTDVYRLLPNYTDVNSFAERGWLTLNLAPIGNETRYHSPGDDLAALDPATVQHMGDQTLALATALANGTPQVRDSDTIFMDIAGRALVSLPLAAGVALLAMLLLGFAILTVRRGGALRGAAIVVGTFAGSAVLAWLALALIELLRPGMFWRAEPVWTHLSAYALSMFVAASLLCTVGRPLDVRQLRAAFWLLLLAIGALIGLVAPGGIIFFLLPPLIALMGMIGERSWKPAEPIGSIAAILFFYATWGGMLGLLEELLNGGPMWPFTPLGGLLVLPALIEAKPLIDRAGLRNAAGIAGLLALLGWSIVLAVPAYSADRQQRVVIQHVTDTAKHKSWWSVLNDGAALPKAFPGQWTRGKLPFSDRPRWVATAPLDATANAPGIHILSQVRNGNERTLTVRLAANGNEHVELIAPADARIRAAGVEGFVRPIDQAENGKYVIACFGRSCDGATLQLTIDRAEPVDFLVLGGKAPLPPGATPLIAARPRFARPQYNRDESIAFTSGRL